MVTLPFVSYSDRFDCLSCILKDEFPFAINGFFDKVKREEYLDSLWWQATNGADENREGAYVELYGALTGYISNLVSDSVYTDIMARLNTFIVHAELAMLDDMPLDHQQAVWDAWDRMESQQAEDDRIAQWRNEY